MVKVQPGSPWRVPAAAQQNAWDAAAEDYQRRERSGGGGDRRGPMPTDTLTIKNSSGANRRQGDVLEVSDPLITTLDADHLWLDGILPTAAAGKVFGVLRQPLPSTAIGSSVLQLNGTCLAFVNVTDTGHNYADVAASNAVLQSGASGPVQIAYKPAGTGERTCLVRLGSPSSGENEVQQFTISESSISATAWIDDSNGKYPAAYTHPDVILDGTDITIQTTGSYLITLYVDCNGFSVPSNDVVYTAQLGRYRSGAWATVGPGSFVVWEFYTSRAYSSALSFGNSDAYVIALEENDIMGYRLTKYGGANTCATHGRLMIRRMVDLS